MGMQGSPGRGWGSRAGEQGSPGRGWICRAALAGAGRAGQTRPGPGAPRCRCPSCAHSWQSRGGSGSRVGAAGSPGRDSAAPEVGAGEGAAGGRWGRCEVTCPEYFGWVHTHNVPGAGSCPSQPLLPQNQPAAPAHLERETEAERGWRRCGQGEGRGCVAVDPPLMLPPRAEW